MSFNKRALIDALKLTGLTLIGVSGLVAFGAGLGAF